MRRPICTSVYSENPAYTSAIREKSFFSSAFSEFHGRTASAAFATSSGSGFNGVSFVSLGSRPLAIMRGSTHSRYASYPESNLPLYLSMYSFGA
jgi:hypothetical protein